jgi:predicted aldo/keto reductase-like oxidoreductase
LEFNAIEQKHNNINRRNFLKNIGAAGLGSVFASAKTQADTNAPGKEQKPKFPQVPRRTLGKTGIDVPCLSLGGDYNFIDNQIMLRKSLQWGVNYWDTAHWYSGGNSEIGIGKFLAKNPEIRKELFIATKASGAESIKDVEKRLQTSLKRMNTEYIDLYYGVHMLSDPSLLTDELKQWAKDAKQRKVIRFFGFSTHTNMTQCLAAAAKLDWIDVIMTSYNFRLMQDPKMAAAVEACHKAGIGLIAMKVTGQTVWQPHRQDVETEEDKKIIGYFLQRGFTEAQAKIKVVLEDKRFSAACIGMDNIAILTSNVAAALDKTKLTRTDKDVLKEYARTTCSGYCAGCANICHSALPQTPYVSEIMRYLMYYNSYGEQNRARQLFAQIPGNVRKKLLSTDYSTAEARCPQHLPIAELMAEAVSKLA